MTVAEASAVNKVIDLLSGAEHDGSEDQLRDGLSTLAAGANKRLGAGVRPEQIASLSFPRYHEVIWPDG